MTIRNWLKFNFNQLSAFVAASSLIFLAGRAGINWRDLASEEATARQNPVTAHELHNMRAADYFAAKAGEGDRNGGATWESVAALSDGGGETSLWHEGPEKFAKFLQKMERTSTSLYASNDRINPHVVKFMPLASGGNELIIDEFYAVQPDMQGVASEFLDTLSAIDFNSRGYTMTLQQAMDSGFISPYIDAYSVIFTAPDGRQVEMGWEYYRHMLNLQEKHKDRLWQEVDRLRANNRAAPGSEPVMACY